MRELTKDVTLNEGRYQVQKMDARTASWLSNLLVASMLKMQPADNGGSAAENSPEPELSPEDKAKGAVAAMWLTCGATLSEDVYAKVQSCCLKACRVYDGASGAAMPILMNDGRWACKELENDAPTVNSLIMEAMQFNLSGFFYGAASKAASPEQ